MLRVGKSKLKALAAAATLAAPAISLAQTNGTWTSSSSGTWNTVANWFNSQEPSGNATQGGFVTLPSNNTAADQVTTITVTAARTIGGINFLNNGSGGFSATKNYLISGNATQSLTGINVGPFLTINADAGTHRINANIVTNNSFVKTGNGTVILQPASNNDFNGQSWEIDGGTVVAATLNSFQEVQGITVNAGGFLQLGTASLSPGNLGAIPLMGLTGNGATIRSVNGDNSVTGNFFILNTGVVDITAGSFSVNGSMIDQDFDTLNGIVKNGVGSLTLNTMDLTGEYTNNAGTTRLVGNVGGGIGTALIAGGQFLLTAGSLTVGAGNMNVGGGNLTISGTGRLIGTTNVTAGSMNLNGGTHTGNINVTGGTFTSNGTLSTVAGVLAVNSGTALFNGGNVNTVNVNGGTARMIQQGSPNSAAGRLTVKGLNIAAGQRFNVTNNTLVVDYTGSASPEAAIRQYLINGLNGGNWDGATGLNSSTAQNDPTFLTGLGYIDNNLLGHPNYPLSSILVKYTYYGDADMSGLVDLDDFTQFLFGFENNAVVRTNPQIWVNGDWDYSGLVDLDDFTLFLLTLGQPGLGALGAAIEAAGLPDDVSATMLGMVAAVPEPSSALAILSLGTAVLGLRRRRQSIA